MTTTVHFNDQPITEPTRAECRRAVQKSDAATGGAPIAGWRDFAEDDGQDVRAWADTQFDRVEGVVSFAKAFTTYSLSWGLAGFSGGLSDRVAAPRIRADLSGLETLWTKLVSEPESRS